MAVERIVVVGCGSIGQRHARLLAKRQNLQVDLCDADAACVEQAKSLIGNRQSFPNLSEALAAKPDAVIIATPHACHADQVMQSLDARVNVLCEKPMSNNLADANRILQAANKSPCILDFGFTLHFHPALNRLKELITSGQLGRIVHMHCRVGTYATLECSVSRHQANEEGALLLDYVHQPDILYWLSGREPESVYMTATLAGDLPLRSNPNAADILLDYNDGMRGSIHLNYVQAPQRHEYEIAGDQAWAVLDAESNVIRVGNRENNSVAAESFAFDRDGMFEAEHQAFFDAVDGGRKPESPADSAIVSMRVVDAAMRSWKKKERIQVGTI